MKYRRRTGPGVSSFFTRRHGRLIHLVCSVTSRVEVWTERERERERERITANTKGTRSCTGQSVEVFTLRSFVSGSAQIKYTNVRLTNGPQLAPAPG